MYGNGWKNNNDGTFTATSVRNSFSPLDLYLMGMIPKEQVPPILLIDNPAIDKTQLPQLGATVSGTAKTVTIDDIIAAEGARIPDSTTAQKRFDVGFVLLTRPGDSATAATQAIETLRKAWAGRFAELSQGRGSVANIPASLEITVDSPADGATITGPDVTVSGTVINSSGAETGVTVNGMPATVNGSRFIANHVPLQSGVNSLTVTATDANGLITTVTRTVTSLAGTYLRISSNIEAGTTPLDISLRVDGSFTPANTQINIQGPSSVPLQASTRPNEYTARLTIEGTYTITATTQGPDNQTYTASTTITVLNKTQLETLLQGKWGGMKTALIEKNVEAVVTHLVSEAQSDYRAGFSTYIDKLPLLAQDMNPIELVYVSENRAKARMFRTENIKGTPITIGYPIYYIKEGGVWKLTSF